ncbi:hypothetical protein [Hydrogenimonas sp.]
MGPSLLFRSLLLLVCLAGGLFAYTTIENEPPVYSSPSDETAGIPAPDTLGFEDEEAAKPSRPEERLIYLTIEDLPKKIYVGQVFGVTIKITSLRKHVPYYIELQNGRNAELVEGPQMVKPRAINHLTYYFKALGTKIQLPVFTVRYEDSDRSYRIESVTLTAVRLNPPREFSGLLAQDLKLLNYQASAYDETHNILSLQLVVSYGNVDDFRLPGALKQGIDAREGDLNATSLLYYGVYDVDTEEVVFSYFNVLKNRYEKFQVPILVKRSSVSTQTNLDPQASEFTKFKIAVVAFFILLWAILWYRHRGWLYPILIGLATAYLLTYLIPLKSVCIRPGSTVYLLPTPQSTPFTTLPERTTAKEMHKNRDYTKVQLPNNRIGWVKNEDICQN